MAGDGVPGGDRFFPYEFDMRWKPMFVVLGVGDRDGVTLRDKWTSEGTRTFLGLHSHGFPNLFIISGPQGGGLGLVRVGTAGHRELSRRPTAGPSGGTV